MGKLFRSLVLLAAVAGLLTAAGPSAAPAQVKEKDKAKKDDKTKKDEKAKTDEVGVTEVYMAKDGWRWRVKNAEGKSIAIGTIGYDKKEDALKAVETVKGTLTKGKVEVKDEKK